ncbi:uncharacterized protein LOC127287087 isoform X3 [Leptopilina boulardi]|uniref:uncharacterized protein LOC127287087 isoform X3 n=1 Tax=Leptopilina boulardi TaxID=63433 RepID=UPI0021F66025|nr:uncharacterized protein LOC127287087 isoform X3 [Leptopilina boulardi]
MISLLNTNMEIMEDGNLVDRVRILLQRDMKYYQEMQTVLRETVCVRVSGGKLDFPRHASFAAIKIVTWWEAEFSVAFKGPSGLSSNHQENDLIIDGDDDDEEEEEEEEEEEAVIKTIQPSELILLVIDTSEQLIEHLHTLIQESLDHADLTVLTATLGAAALVRNCLWCYNQRAKGKVSIDSSEKLYKCYKSFQEMSEAVAERLLDLHCRLISLYVLNEADSLNWECERSFFEKERSSYVIQMWWLYMQGTKADLWNTVSPKMAQRIFSGMLNESLTILTSRFVHGRPSLARSEQFWADAFNVLCCTAYLTLSACLDGKEMIGSQKIKLSILMRDIHSKCYELLVCLLLRGTPLKILYQVFRNGLENLIISQPRSGPSPWLIMSASDLLGSTQGSYEKNFSKSQAIILEINVLKSQPQPNWPQTVKVFLMNDYVVSKLLLRSLVRQCIGKCEDIQLSKSKEGKKLDNTCGGFLCAGNSCRLILNITANSALFSLIFILINTVNDPLKVIVPALKLDPSWSNYLDRQQMWNQSRPPWLNALLFPLHSMMTPIVETLLDAVKTGASIYQAMSLALACLMELHISIPIGILRTAIAMNENIPAHCRPIGGSVLLQIMCAALYTALLQISTSIKSKIPRNPMNLKKEPGSFDPNDKSSSSLALAEALCSIDEDNKHTVQIDDFLRIVKKSIDSRKQMENIEIEDMSSYIEVLTDELLFKSEGRHSLKIAHEYLIRASNFILDALKSWDVDKSEIIIPADVPIKMKTLNYIMFHIGDKPFDQLLIGYEDQNWERMFSIPLSISPERIRGQLLVRPDLRNIDRLTSDEQEVANFLKQLCTTGRSARFR